MAGNEVYTNNKKILKHFRATTVYLLMAQPVNQSYVKYGYER